MIITKKKIFLILMISLFILIILVGFGFYSMDIEDQYGDFQDVYYKSKSGDIIINSPTKEFGLIDKDSHRIYVVKGKEKIDFTYWINNKIKTKKFKLYRTSYKLGYGKIEFARIKQIVESSNSELVLENE